MTRPPAATLGLIFGLALGFAGAFGGIVAFIVVLVMGVVGLLVGRAFDGELDLSGYLGGGVSRRER